MKYGACLCTLVLAAGLARAESLEEVEKKLLAAHAQLQSYSARMQHRERLEMSGTDYMATEVTGTIEWMRKGDKILYRLDMSGTVTQKFGEAEPQVIGQTSTLVSDGTHYFTLAEQLGHRRFIKQKVDTTVNGDIRSIIDIVKADNSIALAPDDKVEGAECHVIELTPKDPPGDDDPIHKTLLYFRKDIGLNVKVVSRNKAGKTVYDRTLVDLKINPSIEPSRFVLERPADVELTDLTDVTDAPPSSPPAQTP